MPHLIVEYTRDMEEAGSVAALRALNEALMSSGEFEERSIKSRAYAVEAFVVGTADEARGFVSARLAILDGRSAATKRKLSQLLLDVLCRVCGPAGGLQVQVTVEVRDMDRDSYAKATLGA